MLDKSKFEELPDEFKMIQALEEQLHLHKEGQQEQQMAREKLQAKLIGYHVDKEWSSEGVGGGDKVQAGRQEAAG